MTWVGSIGGICNTRNLRQNRKGGVVAKKKKGESSEALLWPILDKESDLRKEFRKRNPKFNQKRIKSQELESYLDDGWVSHKRAKSVVTIRRDKKIDERLENLWWVLLYKMGYTELNSGRNFRIRFQRRNDIIGEKQIDVFASDDETVIVAECKACERLRNRSLQKDIEEFGAIKGEIATAIKKFSAKITSRKFFGSSLPRISSGQSQTCNGQLRITYTESRKSNCLTTRSLQTILAVQLDFNSSPSF